MTAADDSHQFLRGSSTPNFGDGVEDDARRWSWLPAWLLLKVREAARAAGLSLRQFIVRAVENELECCAHCDCPRGKARKDLARGRKQD